MPGILIGIEFNSEETLQLVNAAIQSVDRLGELVITYLLHEKKANDCIHFSASDNAIEIRPGWLEHMPALVFPSSITLTRENILGILFGFLQNREQYQHYLSHNTSLLLLFQMHRAILDAEPADVYLNELENLLHDHTVDSYFFHHNTAIVLNYGIVDNEPEQGIEEHYQQSLLLAPDKSYYAYTVKYYGIYLLDSGLHEKATALLNSVLDADLGDDAYYSIMQYWCRSVIAGIEYADAAQIKLLKERLWETLSFFEKNQQEMATALLWLDAVQVAQHEKSFSEALGYLHKAQQIFDNAGEDEMLARTSMLRAGLFTSWARSGQPQFYKPAFEAYQLALKKFTRQKKPALYATIHHQLGILYAEATGDHTNRNVWAALSVSSFMEAFSYFNKMDHPYEFGMICNHFGMAFTQYPASRKGNSLENAIAYFEEALSVRPAETYPQERALTLLNYLEVHRQLLPAANLNETIIDSLLSKSYEIQELTDNQQLKEAATVHRAWLDEARKSHTLHRS